MKLIRLSFQNLLYRPLNLVLSLLLFSLGIGLISLMFILNKQITQKFENNLAGIDLIIGAKGSPLQMVLNGLYHIDAPTGNISLKDAEPFLNPNHPLIKKAVPLSLGDSYNGFRIVGTNLDFPTLYNATLASGTWWQNPMEVTIGSSVASLYHLKIGDTFVSSHGLTIDEFNQHEHAPYSIVGIIKSTGSVCDQLILTSPESIWQVHEHTNPVNNTIHSTDTLVHDSIPIDSALLADRQITTILIQYKSKTNIAALNMQRNINQNTQLQAATPAIEINRLFSMMGIGFDAIRILAWVIAFVSGLSIFISLYNSLKERRNELALMRVMGANPGSLFSLIIYEGLIVAVLGFILGILMSHLVLQFSAEIIFKMYKYRINPWRFIPEEAGLLAGALAIGFIAAIIPAIQAYRTEIAKNMNN
ncbi:MAG: FtsX-like permease family protein [Saprospiraceae bacterium]